MTLKLGSRGPVLVESIEVPAASANVSDKHIDVVEDDPALPPSVTMRYLTFVTPSRRT
jgi:hypothetical protein